MDLFPVFKFDTFVMSEQETYHLLPHTTYIFRPVLDRFIPIKRHTDVKVLFTFQSKGSHRISRRLKCNSKLSLRIQIKVYFHVH